MIKSAAQSNYLTEERKISKSKITYQKVFWLFMVGSVFGVFLEGFFCLFRYGKWETHVVSIWGPFCIIYGMGLSGIYIGSVLMEKKNSLTKFVVFALIATFIEYICGVILKYGLGMKAWDYSKKFLNIDGVICLQMTVIWGLIGIAFSKYIVGYVEKTFQKMQGQGWKILCVCLSVFMAVNLSLTAVAVVRWSQRHYGIASTTKAEMIIDETVDEIFDDSFMKNRFVEWKFLK